MKNFRIFLLSFIFLVTVSVSWGQKAVRLYAGANYSWATKFYSSGIPKLDDSIPGTKPILLPNAGFDYDLPLNRNWSVTTGLGFSMMGTKNYNSYRKGDTSNTSFNDNLHLRIMHLRIPIVLKYQVKPSFYLFCGYAFNNTIRLNQNIAALDNRYTPARIGFIYRKIQHAALFGVRKDWSHVSLALNYHLGLNHVYDTGNIGKPERAYMDISGLQFSVGYLFKDEQKK
jgi:Outer membrane protein beta-barrel domain